MNADTYLLWGGPSHGRVVATDRHYIDVAVREADVPLWRKLPDPMEGLGKWQQRLARWTGLDAQLSKVANNIPRPEISTVRYIARRRCSRNEVFHLMFPDGKEADFNEVDANYVREKFPAVVRRLPPGGGFGGPNILKTHAR